MSTGILEFIKQKTLTTESEVFRVSEGLCSTNRPMFSCQSSDVHRDPRLSEKSVLTRFSANFLTILLATSVRRDFDST